MDNYFYEIFENIPRQGPGIDAATEQAWNTIKDQMPSHPRILDIGCGKGAQTLVLAKITGGDILANDIHQAFLDSLEAEAEAHHLKNIRCMQGDMASLPFKNEEFDLVWAEGSAFIMGVNEAMKNWKRFIRKDGFLVVSDLVWLQDSRPRELTDYFEAQCPYVLTVNELREAALRTGYQVHSFFTLPDEGWIDQYYVPQQQLIDKLRIQYADLPEVQELYDSLEKEHEIYRRYGSYYGYVFFMLRNTARSQQVSCRILQDK